MVMEFKGLVLDTFVMPFVINFMSELLTKENFALYGDKLFDFIEEMVKNSETKWDDKTVLPLLEMIRLATEVPDLPDK